MDSRGSLTELGDAPDAPWSALIPSLSIRPAVASICPCFIFKSFKILSILHSEGGIVCLSNSDTQIQILLDSLSSDAPS